MQGAGAPGWDRTYSSAGFCSEAGKSGLCSAVRKGRFDKDPLVGECMLFLGVAGFVPLLSFRECPEKGHQLREKSFGSASAFTS